MNNTEEAVVEQILRLMERLLSPIILTVSDSVRTTSVADETNHTFSVTVEAPKSRSQFSVFWGPVPEEPEQIPGRLISNILFVLNKKDSPAFKQYSCSPNASQINPNTKNIAFEIDKKKAVVKVEKNVFERIKEDVMGRILATDHPNFLIEVSVEGDKARVIIAPYEGKEPASEVFEVFASEDLRMPGLIIQKILNDAIINHFLGTVIQFELRDEKGNLLDARKISPSQNYIIFRRTK